MYMPAQENSIYRRVYMRFPKFFSRRRWFILATLIFFISLIIIFARYSVISAIDNDEYTDDVPEELYRAVLNKWYNFSDGEKWYNKKNISALEPATWEDLLSDIRDNWIIWNYNSNESYFLQEPHIKDPSMGQSAIIYEILNKKKNGFFIECGAYDGETRSNTLFLETKGWSGLLIEADPINFTKMLQKNRRAYLSPTCLSTSESPMMEFFLMAGNIGRLHNPENLTENTSPTNTADVAYTGKHTRVQCLPFILYIAALGVKTVDYFSLDIEGNEIDVLKTIPFDKVDIKTLSVEHIHTAKGRKYMIDMMEQRGYYVHSFLERSDNLANDVIFVKRDIIPECV